MFRFNLQRIRVDLLNTLQTTVRSSPFNILDMVTRNNADTAVANWMLWRRLLSQYQFRTKKEIYYPNRNSEMKRPTVSPKFMPIGKTLQHRGLPKDYYYKVLGVNRYASIQQIRSAFYNLAKRYHPDSTHSEEKLKQFQELSNAYNILTDETKRLEYDQLGGIKDEQAFLAQAGNPMNINMGGKKHETNTTPSQDDIKKLTSNDLDMPVSFLEATVGCKKRIDLRYLRKCENCKGKSQLMINRDVGREPCRRCSGTGKVTTKTLTYTSVNTCSQCKGKRFINRNDCETCENRGYVVCSVEVLVTIPSGSQAGDVISVENPNTKQKVNYHLKVPNSDYFRRIGNDIYTDKYLNISDAILGGHFTIRGLYENVEVRVEAGTQSHTKVVLSNKGVRTRDGVGNHIITLKVRIPRNLSMKQRQLVLALAQAEDPVFERQKGANKIE